MAARLNLRSCMAICGMEIPVLTQPEARQLFLTLAVFMPTMSVRDKTLET